ncbi:S8 family peptidase [Faecalicatena contorta]|uniref:S8 family peptidase n=1 Tax=Faecalicatena contorta TaxID=39482 RepID=UPI00189C0C78|nr:S8 family peptidase [Faecalicatena contorta]
MNNILQLKGKFLQRKNANGFGPINLPKGSEVTEKHIKELTTQLKNLEMRWKNEQPIGGALISVHYKCIVAKSNRLQILLGEKNMHPNMSIRGAKFVDGINEKNISVKKHVFTYFISFEALRKSIGYLEKCEQVLKRYFGGKLSDKDTALINSGKYNDSIMAKSTFLKVILDANYVERFDLDQATEKIKEQSIVTIYKTGVKTTELLGRFGIDMINTKMIDETTLRLEPREIEILQNNASYLIAMHVKNFAEIVLNGVEQVETNNVISIPEPQNEPVVGVIDTQFDESVYFGKWVEYENRLDSDIPINAEDRFHGTAVSSIIVDGPTFNPKLQDDCGRFRVRHFGVAIAGRFSSFAILKMIRDIVAQNRDIKVWNLSLGSAMEIDYNFISPEAAELDRIQSEYDVIFVVAGTNRGTRNHESVRIGAPADSLNSLVVNAVDFQGKPASYTRRGPVLSFFYKPDICYYGGDGNEKITVCEPLGMATVCGTSFAAPWITRKMAYLIHIVGLSREIAKALIIDSAAGWNRRDTKDFTMGYGIVPKKIGDITHSRDDEIRFIMSGTIDEYETYTYNIPVPQDMNTYPFFAKATLAYFPSCDRNQGVDYTSTEMDLHFGRIIEKDGKAIIKSIDYNKQADEGIQSIYEEDARRLYRKWDNIKHISEALKENARARKAYPGGVWGLNIKTKERLMPKAGRGLQFGVVITLKEMNGVNRIDDFIKLCMVRGWLINRIDVQNQIDIYNKAEEEIEFE